MGFINLNNIFLGNYFNKKIFERAQDRETLSATLVVGHFNQVFERLKGKFRVVTDIDTKRRNFILEGTCAHYFFEPRFILFGNFIVFEMFFSLEIKKVKFTYY